MFEVLADQKEISSATQLPKGQEWVDERNVVQACAQLGYEVEIFGIHSNLQELIDKLQDFKPDIVFNLAEAFDNDRAKEADIASIINLLNIKITGADSQGLNLCKDKALSKRILSSENINVPEFHVVHKGDKIPKLDFNKKYIVKPLDFEGSEGISFRSVVSNKVMLKRQIQSIHESYDATCIVEEYIDGRELYVGIMGNQKLEVLPPIEFFMSGLPDSLPNIASYRAKWDSDFRKKYKLKSGIAKSLSDEVKQQIIHSTKMIYRVFSLKGYARIDFRLTADNLLYFIEANPNPSIAKSDEFAKAAKKAGYEYQDLIQKIVRLGMVA